MKKIELKVSAHTEKWFAENDRKQKSTRRHLSREAKQALYRLRLQKAHTELTFNPLMGGLAGLLAYRATMRGLTAIINRLLIQRASEPEISVVRAKKPTKHPKYSNQENSLPPH